MRKVYTLSVVDEDGTVTGDPGRILVASREFMLDESVYSYRDMMQGHAATVKREDVIWIWQRTS